MRPIVLNILLALSGPTASAQVTVGAGVGLLYGQAGGTQDALPVAPAAEAWIEVPLVRPSCLSVQVAVRHAWGTGDTEDTLTPDVPGAPPGNVSIRATYPDPLLETGHWATATRLRFQPWPRSEVRPVLTAGAGWVWRPRAPDTPIPSLGIGVSVPLGAFRASWELDAWCVRVDRTDLVLVREGATLRIGDVGPSREWQPGAGVRFTLAYSIQDAT